MEFKEINRCSAEIPIIQVKQEANNDDNDSNQCTSDYIGLCNINVKEEFIDHADTDSEESKLLTDVIKEEYVLTYPDVDVIQREFEMKQSLCLDTSLGTFVNVDDTTSTESDDSVIVHNLNNSVLTTINTDDIKDFECFCCRQTFRNEMQLRTHLKRCFRSFECNICRRRFKCAAYLVTHKRTHVRDYSIKPIDGKKIAESSSDHSIVCTEPGCNKTFTRKDRFIVHMRVHIGDKRYQCDEVGCCKRFTEWSNLEKHRRIHTGEKRFICDEPGCNKKFSAKCNLIEHRRIHSETVPTGDKDPFFCKICDKIFRPSSVRKHLQMHTGVKPYVCTEPGCDKKFMRKYRLIAHNRIHTGERPFACTHCNRKFIDKWSFKKHALTHLGNA